MRPDVPPTATPGRCCGRCLGRWLHSRPPSRDPETVPLPRCSGMRGPQEGYQAPPIVHHHDTTRKSPRSPARLQPPFHPPARAASPPFDLPETVHGSRALCVGVLVPLGWTKPRRQSCAERRGSPTQSPSVPCLRLVLSRVHTSGNVTSVVTTSRPARRRRAAAAIRVLSRDPASGEASEPASPAWRRHPAGARRAPRNRPRGFRAQGHISDLLRRLAGAGWTCLPPPWMICSRH